MARSFVVAELKFNRLPELAALLRPKASAIVRKTASDIEAHAKSVVPVDTGNLKNSIQTEMSPGSLSATVSTNVEYAAAVEFGSQAHVIRPKEKKALSWPGAAHPVKEVHHPGTPPKPFMTPAVEAVRPSFEAAMKKLFD